MMVLRLVLFFFLAPSFCKGQSSLGIPCLGKLVDRAGFLRELCGVSGSLLVSAAASEPVISAGFSRTGGFVKKPLALQVLDGTLVWEASAPTGPALFAFGLFGAPRFVYLVESKELLEWTGQFMRPVEFTPQGQVLSIATNASGGWSAIVRRKDSVVILTATSVVDLVGPAESALLLDGSRLLLFAEGILRLADKSFPMVEAPSVMEWINEDWIHLGGWVLRITPGKEALFQLPEAT